jgi:hypothetical protein
MKKLLLVFAIAAFVACNDSGTAEETPAADTPATSQPAPLPADTTSVGDTTKVDTSSLKK